MKVSARLKQIPFKDKDEKLSCSTFPKEIEAIKRIKKSNADADLGGLLRHMDMCQRDSETFLVLDDIFENLEIVPTTVEESIYEIILEEDEDGRYSVECPKLPGCFSQGDNEEEAIKNIVEAIEGYIETFEKYGVSISEKTKKMPVKKLVDVAV